MLVIKKLNAEKLASLGDTAALDAFVPQGLGGCLASGATVFVLLTDNQPAGVLVMDSAAEGTKPAFLRVRQVAVLAPLRRHGLGRMLMCVAAGEAVERQVWFLGCPAALTAEAQAFADAMHFRAGLVPGALLLDLSDVEGMRHG